MKNKIKNSCINEFDPTALSIENAKNRILKTIKSSTKVEKIKLKDSLGRIVSKDIKSSINIPSFKNSAMDGYALNISHLSEKTDMSLKEAGISYAGKPYHNNLKKGETVRVMTGAVIPNNSNAVVMKEMIKIIDENIQFPKNIKKNQNIRFIGEDVKKSSIILKKGKRINYIDLGILSSAGIEYVDVVKKPIISFFSTGDELISIKKKLKKGQIYDSNRYLLYGLLSELPVSIKDMGVVKDNKSDITKKFIQCSKISDLIITTGGVSVGDADYIREVLDEIGKINFWKISIKPGRPLAYGKIKKTSFFGLPGNPVSTVITFQLFVIPAIEKMISSDIKNKLFINAITKTSLSKKKGRVEYKRAFLTQTKNKFFVETTGLQGSNILTSLAKANCYIKLSANINKVKKGDIVKVLPFMNNL